MLQPAYRIAPSAQARAVPFVETCQVRYSTLLGVSDRPSAKRGVPAGPIATRLQTVPALAHAHGSEGDETLDDAALAQAAMLGQAWAQRAIWYRFAPMVFGLLRRALGARHDHEDLLQEVFLRVYRRLETLQNPGSLRSFVYSFAIRVMREELRRHRLRAKFASFFAPPGVEVSVPHDDFESRELLSRVQAALDGMPGRKRAVFVLRRFDGMELTEIATSLDLSLATVKRDLEKANEHIAKAIHRDERLRAGLQADVGGAALRRTRERG
jgi:RNA polymerase sigma-70 factor (ECF subfamily)